MYKPFIKLTTQIINVSHIIKIVNYPTNNKYNIFMTSNNISGFFLLSIGTLSSNDTVIEISKEKDIKDYQIIDDWIKEM